MYIESVMVWNNKGNIVRIILISQEETIVRDEEVYCNPIYLNVDRSSPLHGRKQTDRSFHITHPRKVVWKRSLV